MRLFQNRSHRDGATLFSRKFAPTHVGDYVVWQTPHIPAIWYCAPPRARDEIRHTMSGANADQEKGAAALNSVVAALVLTALKIVVGVLTGSLGILAEAAHSALDLVAAFVTWIAVRVSSKPADEDHAYGHGKVEHLSALVETLLLLATCAWIISEAVARLTAHHVVHVEASRWAFLVLGISMAVDISRSRMLRRAAEKHRSQALEADALHFSTDVWSSAVVIAGLIGVKLADWFPALASVRKADAVAALAVAVLVIVVSVRVGLRTSHGLLDSAPTGAAARIKTAVEAIENVVDCHAIRVRESGPNYFVDLHLTLDGAQTLQQAHELTERAEEAVRTVLPDADVTVHPEPKAGPAKSSAV